MKHAITTTTHNTQPYVVARCKGAMLNVPVIGDHALDNHREALRVMLDYQGGEDNAPLDRWVAGVLPQGGYVWLPIPSYFQDTRPQVCSNNFNWAGPPAEPKQAYILQTPVDPFHPERGLQKQETYDPRATLERQYSFATINGKAPVAGDTTRWHIKAAGGLVLWAYSWPKKEGETCDN